MKLVLISNYCISITMACVTLYPSICNSQSGLLYVSPTGKDTYSGTYQYPFRTIKKGLQILKPGGTLVLRSGVYEETIDNSIPSGISLQVPTTIKGEDGDGSVIIKPRSAYRVVYISGKSFINIQNVILDGSHVTYDGVKTDKTSYVKIMDCSIQNVKGNGNNYVQGLLVSPTSSYVNVINCIIHNNGRGRFDHGIYINGDNCHVDNTIIYNNAGYGVHIYNEYKDLISKANNNTVSNSMSYNNGTAGFLIGSGKGNTIYNCISTSNKIGIHIGYNSLNSAVIHNTVYDNTQLGILIRIDSLDTLVQNNISYGNRTDFSNLGAGTISAGNLFGINPQFIDASNKDFRLTKDSPAIGVGVSSVVGTDCKGTNRNPTTPDAGAYEFTR